MLIIQYFNNFIQLLFNQINLLSNEISILKAQNKAFKRKINSLKKQIKYLKNDYPNDISGTSRSPLYEYFKLDKEAIHCPIIDKPNLNYLDILDNGSYKPSKAHLKPDFPNKEKYVLIVVLLVNGIIFILKLKKGVNSVLKLFLFVKLEI
ncbi:hypothetical protein [Oceanivirga salmonicida]|uniref:hypothetical protein n=1 Tax=Oceanivirga salmonicida TaxID=1769291 RepID=UPI0012E12566|nr:hypothetical protein [Oceanivirga salmonicida]